MKLCFKVAMSVTASTPAEAGRAAELQGQIEALGLRTGRRRGVRFDDSLMNDFNRIIADLGQLMNRADARRRRRRK